MTSFDFILDPPPGISSDDSDFRSEFRWRDSDRVRFWNGRPRAIGGWAKLFSTALTGVVRKMLVLDRSGTATIAYATSSKIYVGSGGAQPDDRTPVGYPTQRLAVSLGAWGSTLLVAPKGGTLYEQIGASTAAEVTNAPDQINCMLVSADRRQVIAFGCNEEASGTFNGLCIRWCDFEDYTDWTTSNTNNAGEFIIPGAGQIIAAALVGPVIWFWTETALWQMSFRGDPGQTYDFNLIDDNAGICGPNAVEVFNGQAYWVRSDMRLLTAAPGALPKLIPNPVSETLTGSAWPPSVVVSGNTQYGEIWIHYTPGNPGVDEASLTRAAVAFSVETGLFFRCRAGDGRSAVLDDGALSAAIGSTYYPSTIIAGDRSGNVFVHEYGDTANGSTMSSSIVTGAFYIDKGRRRVMAQEVVYESFAGTLQIQAASDPSSIALDDPGTSLTLTGARRKTFRKSGKFFRFTITATSNTNAGVEYPKMIFKVVPMGER